MCREEENYEKEPTTQRSRDKEPEVEGRETQRPAAENASPVPLVWLGLSKGKIRQHEVVQS